MSPEAIPIPLLSFAYFLCVQVEPLTLSNYGGEETSIEEVPYIVSIIKNNNHICGGIIIDTNWILTAAHCVEDGYGLEIQAGLVNLLNPGRQLQKMRVEEVFLHPCYVNREDSMYDVALLLLEEELEFNLAVESISVLSQTQLEMYIINEEPATISGWGSSEAANASVSNRLYSGVIDLLTEEECEDMFQNYAEFVPDAHLCSSTLKSEKLSGALDDGGPLVIMDKLAGFIINGKQNIKRDHPNISTVYAAIPFHASFIQTHLPHLISSNEGPSSSNSTEKSNSLILDLILVSGPPTDSMKNTKTFIFSYNIHFPESWNIVNPERSISSQCSKKWVSDNEKWILSIEIAIRERASSPPSKYRINVNLAKYIK